MKPLRAKFRTIRVEPYNDNDGKTISERVVAMPVYKDADPEGQNTKFWNATPSGMLDLYLSNPEAFGQFALGREFYLDFAPIEPPASVAEAVDRLMNHSVKGSDFRPS